MARQKTHVAAVARELEELIAALDRRGTARRTGRRGRDRGNAAALREKALARLAQLTKRPAVARA